MKQINNKSKINIETTRNIYRNRKKERKGNNQKIHRTNIK